MGGGGFSTHSFAPCFFCGDGEAVFFCFSRCFGDVVSILLLLSSLRLFFFFLLMEFAEIQSMVAVPPLRVSWFVKSVPLLQLDSLVQTLELKQEPV